MTFHRSLCVVPAIIACSGMCAAAHAAEAPADSFFARMCLLLEHCRGDIPAMVPHAEAVAGRLAAGGNLYAAGQPSLVSELCGRAGGLMLIKPLGAEPPAQGDAVLFGLTSTDTLPAALTGSGALVIAFGSSPPSEEGVVFVSSHATEANVSPTLANAVPAWVFIGELTAALTRLGRMPVVFESIGMYGGFQRINQYQQKGILWHETHAVPAQAPESIGREYVSRITAMLDRCAREESEKIQIAAQWACEAKTAGHRLIMYSMGHLFPKEVADTEIGTVFESAVWNSGFMQQPVPDHTYAQGDMLIHIGYQHPPYRMLQRARPQGARVAYVDVLCHRDYVDDPDVLWIDPMWSWPDACVPLEGYDIPLLASSGLVNGTIAWEIYRLTRQCLDANAGS